MIKDYPVYKVAAIQAAPVYTNRPDYFDLDATLAKAVNFIEEAGKNGAKLVVFPETFLPGYPHFSMGLQTMAEAGEFFQLWKKYLLNSPVVPGPETERIGTAARKAGCYVAIGMNERDPVHDGRMYNSILYVGPEGKVLGTHRKLNITINEQFFHTRADVSRVEPCDNIRVYDTPLGKLSGLICGEHFQPLLKQHLVVEGTQIHAALWPGLNIIKTVMLVMTQALCVSARCWAVLAAPYLPKDTIPQDTYPNNNFHMNVGGSAVIDPLGNIVAGPLYDGEGIVYHDVDLGLIPIGKAETNLMGSYDRRDVLGLVRREQPFIPAAAMERLSSVVPIEYDKQLNELYKRVALLETKEHDVPVQHTRSSES